MAIGRHNRGMTTETGSLAAYFDGWYAEMTGSPAKDELVRRHLGLPPGLLSTSLLGWDGIAEATEALRLAPGDTLLDLACGRGGYGLEIAGRADARLVGVDFSAEAVRQARENASASGRPADFRVGELTATGLDDASVDAVLCVDAIQFAEPQDAAYRELRRLLVPGGRVVLTCWEPKDSTDERMRRHPRLLHVDLGSGLKDAGFVDVEVRERPEWAARERSLWDEVATLDPGEDPALRSLQDEGRRNADLLPLIRRVLATARVP